MKTVLSWSQTADMKCKLQSMANKITMFLSVDQSNEVQCTTIESGKLIWVSFRHRVIDLIQWSVVLSHLHWNLFSRPVASTWSEHAMRKTLPIGCPWLVSNPMAHAAQSANFCMSWSVRNFFNLSSDQKRFVFGSSRVTALPWGYRHW